MAFQRSSTSFVWLDLETGGPDIRYPVIQAAFAATGPMPDFEILDEFEVKLKFDVADCDPEALKKNSYSPEIWAAEAVEPSTAVKGMKDFLERHCSRQMVSRNGNVYYVARGAGHNVGRFDIPALHKLFSDNGEFCPISYQCLDTLPFFVSMYWLLNRDLKSFSMDALAEVFGVDPGGHDAMEDIYANIAIFSKFLKEGFPE